MTIIYVRQTSALPICKWLRAQSVGLSLLCSKICLLCFLAFPQFSAYHACLYAFQKCIILFFLIKRVLHMIENECKVSLQLQHTKISNSISQQEIWGQIYSPLEAADILLSNIFVVLYANNYS